MACRCISKKSLNSEAHLGLQVPAFLLPFGLDSSVFARIFGDLFVEVGYLRLEGDQLLVPCRLDFLEVFSRLRKAGLEEFALQRGKTEWKRSSQGVNERQHQSQDPNSHIHGFGTCPQVPFMLPSVFRISYFLLHCR